MESNPEWLPDLLLFETYEGNWNKYLEAVYTAFRNDFINNVTYYEGHKVGINDTMECGKEKVFWHIITKDNHGVRLPDLSRCERIKWPKPIIDNCADSRVLEWKKNINDEERILLWLVKMDYIVILRCRKNRIYLCTAYQVNQPHTNRKLLKEYEEYIKRMPS